MNGLLILAAFLLYGLFVYGPRFIGRKRKIIGKPYRNTVIVRDWKGKQSIYTCMHPMDDLEIGDTLREVNARRGH
jgi:hypothetical protein